MYTKEETVNLFPLFLFKTDLLHMILKKILRAIILIISGFILMVLIYLLSAYLLARIPVAGDPATGNDVTIYLLTNGVHTDIVVPARTAYHNWTSEVKYENTRSKDSSNKYLAMGWGDKGFYLETPTWADLKASVAFKAATRLSTTAIHATYHKVMNTSDSCREIRVTAHQYKKLISYIRSSFQGDPNGGFIHIKTDANYGDTDAFYEAKGSYSMFHTCNSWVNNGLKATGLKSCFWTPFDTGLFLLYK
jgi:uncharacterized protein (TIGR02117 family)